MLSPLDIIDKIKKKLNTKLASFIFGIGCLFFIGVGFMIMLYQFIYITVIAIAGVSIIVSGLYLANHREEKENGTKDS